MLKVGVLWDQAEFTPADLTQCRLDPYSLHFGCGIDVSAGLFFYLPPLNDFRGKK